MSDKLKNLYQEVILKHNREPHNFEKRSDADYCIEAYNPVCGDQFQIFFDLTDGKITDLSFHGYGCAISKSSISILTKLLNGSSVQTAVATIQQFKNTLSGSVEANLSEELQAFLPVKEHPGRMKCVTLGWDSLSDYLESN